MADVIQVDIDEEKKWSHLNNLLLKTGPFAPPMFEPGQEVRAMLSETKVLVVGAGGLGCELLKDLALSGFKDIHVIDLDTIDVSNLNRQFLFRQKDVGKMKADVAAAFVMQRVPGVRVTPYTRRLETFDKDFYAQFNIVIAGLDNVDARRWLNAMLLSLVHFDSDGNIDPSTVIPFIDGGTEGFKGQARLFLPHLTSCYECSVGTLPVQKGFARCTIASVPRLPEHCIAYAREKTWHLLTEFNSAADYKLYEAKHPGDDYEPQAVKFDADNVEHMSWVFNRAVERANQFNIRGVTYSLTMQVVKNIIPAIASTNALISAACVNEALKARTWCSQNLSNFFMYMGDGGIYSRTFDYLKNPECVMCGAPITYDIDKTSPLSSLLGKLKTDQKLKLKNPSISLNGRALFNSSKNLAHMYADNLNQTLEQLGMVSGSELVVTDLQVLGKRPIRLIINFVDGVFWEPVCDD
eukprot:TRINITY_DN2956_c0_g1_i1.p1 TRINITY_DN2956_c0_g1~~TRINITY_DN2956_c0_g1_i1.p1  ORF type:complete len:484 (-),score=177.56 TRINITY_DN2956_c0_g1_i1:45-1442(-)